jgi:hypothetical protein
MKDAKGHGSDAHSAGVQQVGQPRVLHWEKSHGGHVLLPESGSYPAIASVNKYAGSSFATARPNQYKAQLHESFSGSGKNAGDWSVHGSVQGAKRYIENAIGKSWEAPEIRK